MINLTITETVTRTYVLLENEENLALLADLRETMLKANEQPSVMVFGQLPRPKAGIPAALRGQEQNAVFEMSSYRYSTSQRRESGEHGHVFTP
ncbi:hypothetical protein HOU03_gp331 [Caulobacter phage CcrSC]|uniref:Uncharacterized protein n=1 Tax=Caulobacter phage CcrSC TaxID=2283272 RepID=A0A385EGB7_9CAUD|nr:hypothetical protein HOU03_gp331 [Caulobacter phage CcrSC]AXQ69937.1 hypothetical protein CcrSC_gp355 [Caulobacter phage CcrSC]